MKKEVNSVLFFLFVSIITAAQVKQEKEERIERNALPEMAQQLVQLIEKRTQKVKYYRELDGAKKSYELKFKHQKRWHSVEMDKEGQLEDIEVLVKSCSLKKELLRRIEAALKKDFTRFKIKKIQEQYVLDDRYAPKEFLEKTLDQLMEIDTYEMIISGTTKKGNEWFEFLFDPQGNIIQKRKLLLNGDAHIMF